MRSHLYVLLTVYPFGPSRSAYGWGMADRRQSTPLPAAPALTVHQMTVTLLDVTPRIWRTFLVPSPLPLSSLHHVVQIVMGWTNSHLHEWDVSGITYGPGSEESWGEEIASEEDAILGEVAPLDTDLLYRYDFGDGWEHHLSVDAVVPFDASDPPLLCLDGARACPPEDCGGPFGYEHLLDALSDPADAEHDDMVAWVGDTLDPEVFDRERVNTSLDLFWRTI
jgi:Plasmid pRiA4b ORF-3-like protein